MATGTDMSPQIPRWDRGCNDAVSKGSLPPAMEDCNDENSSQSKTGKPPRNLSWMRHCSSSAFLTDNELDIGIISLKLSSGQNSGFLPIFLLGSWSEKGPKQYMEDEFICVDNLCQHLVTATNCTASAAFYGVFDGHGGIDAASLLKTTFTILSSKIHIKSAFVKTGLALADTKSVDSSSGTTALAALIFGRTMFIANAGYSRAVLGKRGRAIELSEDHKPSCTSERLRIERLGGVIYDGYLNGQLAVARALGDWHIKVS